MKKMGLVLWYVMASVIILAGVSLLAQEEKGKSERKISEEEITKKKQGWNKAVESVQKNDAQNEFASPVFIDNNNIYSFEWIEKDVIGNCYLNNLPALRRRSFNNKDNKAETFYVFPVNMPVEFGKLRISIKDGTLFIAVIEDRHLKSLPYLHVNKWELSDFKEVPWGQFPSLRRLPDDPKEKWRVLNYGSLKPVKDAIEDPRFDRVFYDINAVNKEQIELYLTLIPKEDVFKNADNIKLFLPSLGLDKKIYLSKNESTIICVYDGEKWNYKSTLPVKISSSFRLLDEGKNAIVLKDNKWILMENIHDKSPIHKELLGHNKCLKILKDFDATENFLIQDDNLFSLKTNKTEKIIKEKDETDTDNVIQAIKAMRAK